MKLGQYQLHEQIGQGGFATVYRAIHTTLNTECAVKVLKPFSAASDDALQRFIREAQVASHLEHPHIVSIRDMDQVEGQWFLVMDYFPAQDLKTWQKEHPLSVGEKLQILEDVAAALDYAHAQGIIHRDVKPSNILIRSDQRAALSDFGLALPPADPHLTQLGKVVGSAHYLSPEQAQSDPHLDGRADQYSLAVVAFELFSGQTPFEGDNATAVALMHVTKPPPLPSTINPNLPVELDAVFQRALAKEPAARFASCGEMVQALKNAIEAGELRAARKKLEQAHQLLAQGEYEALHALLDEARGSLALLPQMSDILLELERAHRQAEMMKKARRSFELAEEKAKFVLELIPAFTDPQGIFPVLGLREEPLHLPPLKSLFLQVAIGIAAGLVVDLFLWYVTFRWITRL